MDVGDLVVVHFGPKDVQVAEVAEVAESDVLVDNFRMPYRVEWVSKNQCEQWSPATLDTLGLAP